MNAVAVHKLRVNVKSLAAEARIVGEEIRRTNDPEVKSSLRSHRAWRIKPEARMAQLALAFFRGTPYKRVEKTTKSPPSAKKLAEKVGRFEYVRNCESVVSKWLGG